MASPYRPLPSEGEPSGGSRWPAVWLFGVLVLPQGIYLGFVSTVLPFLLSKALVPVDKIAGISSLLSLPWVFCFLWAPLVDTKLRRKTWLVIGALITALCACVAFRLASLAQPGQLLAVSALGLSGALAASLVYLACGGLLVTAMPPNEQAKASAWYESGKLGSMAGGAASILWFAERTTPVFTSLIIAALVALPSLMVFRLSEPLPVQLPWFKGRVAEIGKEIQAALRSRAKWSVLLMASPVGTGAAVALLPAVASHYGVGSLGVIWTNGVGGGIVLALGSLCGALFPANWDRRLTYVGAGVTNALAAIALLSGYRPTVYYVGTILYLSTTGLCWARYAALLVETVGAAGREVTTRYGLFATAGNIPLVFMIWLDGASSKPFGVQGIFLTDAAGNLLVFTVVALAPILHRIRRHRQW